MPFFFNIACGRFQTVEQRGRPECETLYDVFENILLDEQSHVATMSSCLDPDVASRAASSEFTTVLAAILVSIPFAIPFFFDEECILSYCPPS